MKVSAISSFLFPWGIGLDGDPFSTAMCCPGLPRFRVDLPVPAPGLRYRRSHGCPAELRGASVLAIRSNITVPAGSGTHADAGQAALKLVVEAFPVARTHRLRGRRRASLASCRAALPTPEIHAERGASDEGRDDGRQEETGGDWFPG